MKFRQDSAEAGGQRQGNVDTLLIVTGGRSDLRIAVANKMWEPIGRATHQLLLEKREQLRFIPSNTASERPESGQGDAAELNELLGRHDGEIEVFATRLDDALQKAASVSGDFAMALVLQTCRSAEAPPLHLQRIIKEEPISVGPLLAAYLASRFDLVAKPAETYELGATTYLDYLRGEEDLSASSADEQINPLAIQRIDDALVAAIDKMKGAGIKKPKAILIDSGGLPRLKDPLLALVRFRFLGKVNVIQRSETGGAQLLMRSSVTIQESCQARQIAWRLLGVGDFLGAAYAAQRYAFDPKESPWIQPLLQVAEFMRGESVSGTPFPELEALRRHDVLSLLPALRTESAVASGRITEAITQVFTFYETALKDGVQKWLIDGPVENVDDRAERLGLLRPGVLSEIRQLLTSPTGNRAMIAYKEDEAEARFRFNLEGAAITWCKALDLASNAADGMWVRLNRAFFQLGSDSYRLRNLRNLHTHSCLTEAEVDEAERLFASNGFWIPSGKAGGKVGGCFLDRPLIKEVMHGLVGQDIAMLYGRMVGALIRNIKNHRYVD